MKFWYYISKFQQHSIIHVSVLFEGFCYNIIPTWHTQFCHQCEATTYNSWRCHKKWYQWLFLPRTDLIFFIYVFPMMKLLWLMMNVILWLISVCCYNLIFCIYVCFLLHLWIYFFVETLICLQQFFSKVL